MNRKFGRRPLHFCFVCDAEIMFLRSHFRMLLFTFHTVKLFRLILLLPHPATTWSSTERRWGGGRSTALPAEIKHDTDTGRTKADIRKLLLLKLVDMKISLTILSHLLEHIPSMSCLLQYWRTWKTDATFGVHRCLYASKLRCFAAADSTVGNYWGVCKVLLHIMKRLLIYDTW